MMFMRPTHLLRLWPAVSQLVNEMLAVAGGDAVRQHLTHHPAGLPHNGAAFTRAILVIQMVVDFKAVEADDVPELLAPYLCRAAVQKCE